MNLTRSQILYEDNHLLVLNKPAGLVTMGVEEGLPSLLASAKQYIKQKYSKPGNVYLGTVSRLDAPVTGAILFARTSKAAARLTEQFRQRAVEKIYWAILEGEIEPAQGSLTQWLAKDERHRKMHVVPDNAPGAQSASLSYRRLKTWARQPGKPFSLVEVKLETGRKHQIRLQFSHRGFPVLGDRKYRAAGTFESGIALHSKRLAFSHPTTGEPVEIVAPLPEPWRKLEVKE